MLLFFIAHLFDDCATSGVLVGQSVEMTIEMGANLFFGLCDKSETPAIPQHAADSADRKRASVPDRTEATRAGLEFSESLFAPGKVIEFLIRRTLHLLFGFAIPRNRGMALIQALCGNFTSVIDAHQSGCMRSLLRAEVTVGNTGRGIFPCWPAGRRRNRAQRIVGAREQPIESRQVPVLHGRHYSNAAPAEGILRGQPNLEFEKMKLRSVYIVGLLVFAAPSLAAEEEAEEASPWSGSVKLGYLATSGNTDSSSLNSGFQITYSLELWQHEATAAAIHSTESNATTAEAYDFGWKSARNLTEHDFLFGRLNWRKDRFSSYDQQFSQAVGYGRRLIDSEAHKLNAEIGLGARQSDFIDGTDESESIVSGRLTYNWLMSETSTFGQTIAVESGSSNTYVESVTQLKARLIGGLALVASYTVKNNSDVLPGTEKTDTFTALSLEYAF